MSVKITKSYNLQGTSTIDEKQVAVMSATISDGVYDQPAITHTITDKTTYVANAVAVRADFAEFDAEAYAKQDEVLGITGGSK